ncbi:ScbA/BarX family gamma-butyrolactone biosynthesis protein [Kitasatospora phosalacinea]|uniref:ScbA/BarX family gamma-butyrolactone biosynthesis protein n=1 Tax=Kitasatospora phosalacinea TaxID=2065 RepID=UPI00364C2C19
MPLDGPLRGPGRAALCFDRTVPRSLVHKDSVAEVFLTDAQPVPEDRILVAAQWPRTHTLYRPDRLGCADPLMLIETVRQAAIYLAHALHGVPRPHRFIFSGLDVQLDNHEFTRFTDGPVRAVLDCRYEGATVRGRHRGSLSCLVEVSGRPVGRATARLTAVDEGLYRQLRDRSRPGEPGGESVRSGGTEPLTADQAGRAGTDNVVLARSEHGLVVRVDPGHPGYFEHRSDHLPGMVLIEAFRQAAHDLVRDPNPGLAGRPVPLWLSGLSVVFGSFAELGVDVVVTAEQEEVDGAPRGGVALKAFQGGTSVAHGTATFVPALLQG